MQVSNPNNIKIYNLSAGKTLPEWLTDRKKRALQKNDLEVRQRIELVQDFEMPIVTNCVKACPNKQYIFATGVYKPRVRCYDVSQLSMKFERCMDSEVVKFSHLSDDYTKLVFLQSDRYIEFHAQHGRYYRTRIPKYGRDMTYHHASCDLYFVGASAEIYRLNLEQGRFMAPLKTNAEELYCCEFNPEHHLFAVGTKQGQVECFDPRVRNRVGVLDCTLASCTEDMQLDGIPKVTALKFRDGLHFGAGTSTGQVLMYDLRSDKPLLVKDHQYELPIKCIEFHHEQDLVISMDSRILKLWHRKTGKAFTAIEPGTELNDMCLLPNTGMLFIAQEAPKILTHYIPALGPAPKWCAFLDSLTEELEENPTPTVYDDYKFLTTTEVENLGLKHLIGTSLLRAYMHGYFIDMRLYHKAKSIAEPFAYEDYKRKKIKEKIEETRAARVKVKKLPKVNRLLAEKLIEEEEMEVETKRTKKKKALPNLLKDDRFSMMFNDPNFQVDAESEEFRLLNPVVSKLDKGKKKKREQEALVEQFDEIQDEEEEEKEGRPSSEEDFDDSSSDDEHTWADEVKEQHRMLKKEAAAKRYEERMNRPSGNPKFFELKEGQKLKGINEKTERKERHLGRKSLGDRLKDTEDTRVIHQTGSSIGNMEMTFNFKKSSREERRQQADKQHHLERKKIRRSAGHIIKQTKQPPKFYMGKKVG